MNDNLKTWPDKIFISGHLTKVKKLNELDPYDKATVDKRWYEFETDDIVSVKYIRADIAREREEKLMRAFKALLDDEGYDIPKSEIYRKEGLEELK